MSVNKEPFDFKGYRNHVNSMPELPSFEKNDDDNDCIACFRKDGCLDVFDCRLDLGSARSYAKWILEVVGDE